MNPTSTARVFRCIPLNPQWVSNTRYDLKAIYRRQSRVAGEYDEITPALSKDGHPLWDLIGPLPLRRHDDWMAKGFEYVTVAVATNSPQGLQEFQQIIAPWIRGLGFEPRDFLQHPQLGTWNPKLYLATAAELEVAETDKAIAAIEEHGLDAYESITGKTVPDVIKKQIAARVKTRTASVPTGDASSESVPPATAKEPKPPKPSRRKRQPAGATA